MTSVTVTTRSLLQVSISSASGQFMAFICKGMSDSNSRSSISLSMVAESNSRYQGDESASYVVPDDATIDILSTI
jgi:hypothetical protein